MNEEYAEKVNTMTDEELNAKAAHLCGWTLIGSVGEDKRKELERRLLPDYANDIAESWKLIEVNPDWRWSIYELDNGDWCASPMKVIGVRDEYNLWDHVSEATGETAQRAITKAFILAMEAND